MTSNAKTYTEFWPFYLSQHTKPLTRALHYFGTLLGTAILFWAILSQTWWALAIASLCGYAFAWIGHAFVERNKPATFSYPVWSFISDYHMLWLWMSFRLKQELKQHGLL